MHLPRYFKHDNLLLLANDSAGTRVFHTFPTLLRRVMCRSEGLAQNKVGNPGRATSLPPQQFPLRGNLNLIRSHHKQERHPNTQCNSATLRHICTARAWWRRGRRRACDGANNCDVGRVVILATFVAIWRASNGGRVTITILDIVEICEFCARPAAHWFRQPATHARVLECPLAAS